MVSAGSETLAERASRAERDMRTEQLLRTELDRIEDPELDWDPLPAEIDGVDRGLRRIEAWWQGGSRREPSSTGDPLPLIRAQLDALEKQLQADER